MITQTVKYFLTLKFDTKQIFQFYFKFLEDSIQSNPKMKIVLQYLILELKGN